MQTYPETRRFELAEPAGGTTAVVGAVAGLAAGAAMMLVCSVWHAVLENGVWTPAREIACSLYGLEALILGGQAVAAGLLVHALVSMAWGILFSALLPRGASGWTAAWTGAAYGAGVWGIMTYGILPWANDVMRARVAMLPEPHLYGHLAYGLCLGLVPVLRRLTRGGSPAWRRSRRRVPLVP